MTDKKESNNTNDVKDIDHLPSANPAHNAPGVNAGTTVLMLAILGGSIEVVEILIKAGADVNTRDACGVTALILAAYRRDVEIVKSLIKAGASIDEKEAMGNTALMYAARNVDAEMVKVLLEAGADPNASDNKTKEENDD